MADPCTWIWGSCPTKQKEILYNIFKKKYFYKKKNCLLHISSVSKKLNEMYRMVIDQIK